MMDRVSVCSRISNIFCKELQIEPPADDANLVETGVLDSLMFVSLLLHVEQDFGVKINLEELEIENFNSVAKIANFVLAANGHKPS